jgi:hypothetical protein
MNADGNFSCTSDSSSGFWVFCSIAMSFHIVPVLKLEVQFSPMQTISILVTVCGP